MFQLGFIARLTHHDMPVLCGRDIWVTLNGTWLWFPAPRIHNCNIFSRKLEDATTPSIKPPQRIGGAFFRREGSDGIHRRCWLAHRVPPARGGEISPNNTKGCGAEGDAISPGLPLT